MPQHNLRSAVYRSFVTCEDPKGVVDCKTIRKSRTRSQEMDPKIETRRTPKNSNAVVGLIKAEKEEMLSKGFTEEVHSSHSFRLMEVSRGAQKLNQSIDSWSKGVRFDGQSTDIARDLLKGALDLQESLIMLRKLQEASDYMARLKKKQNEKSERARIDEDQGVVRTHSSHSGDQNCSMESQKTRLSLDGSSRNPIEELKKMISDSLAKQNLLPNTNTNTEEIDYLHRRDFDWASEIPSTSSNHSLTVHASEFGSTDSSLSSTASQKKTKGPNLIAKLMGLEDLPPKPRATTLQKHLESERISNQRRPIFDIDMPKGRKPQSVAQNVDPERRILKKILETMQFKGLLKSLSAKELKPQSYDSSYFHSKQRSIGEMPPIVLIKPMHVPCQVEELHTPLLPGEEALNTKKMLKKMKIKGVLPQKTRKEGVLGSKNIHSKTEAEDTPIRTLSSEGGARVHKEVARKTEDREGKSREKVSNKRGSGPIDHKPRKKEAIDKKADKIQKVAFASRKPWEMENVKTISEDSAKENSTKLKRFENESNFTKNQVLRQPSTPQNTISGHATKAIISSSTDQIKNQMKQKKKKKKEKPAREPIEADSVIRTFGANEDDKRISLRSENCSPLIGTNTTLADQLPVQEEKDATESHFGDHCSKIQGSLSDVSPLSPNHEIDGNTAEEAYNSIFHSRADIKSFKTGNDLKALLLRSPSFRSCAEELFDLHVTSSTAGKASGINDLIVANGRLSLECANELIERKSLRDSWAVHPLLLTRMDNLRISISMDMLVEEVCKGVENLRSYSNIAGESLLVDSLFAMLERDIRCNGVENGIWEMGWRHGFSVDDAKQVVNEIEKLVFNGLIEEVLQ